MISVAVLQKLYTPVYSDFLINEFDVPQGSILGPLLFLIYVNELRDLIHSISDGACLPVLYVDDANLIITGQSLDHISSTGVTITKALIEYLVSLNLIVNVEKTQCLFFSLKNNLRILF